MLFGNDPEDDWPRWGVVIPHDAHALGVFTAFYNLLEPALVDVVECYLDAPKDVREMAYFGMSNRQRSDFTLLLATKSEKDGDALECVRHLLTCFDDCVQNRNILLHAAHEGSRDGAEARKRASDNVLKALVFDVSLPRLREAAEAVRRTHDFLRALVRAISAAKTDTQLPLPGFTQRRPALPEKPPRPNRLIPRQPDPVHGTAPRPQKSSRAKRRPQKTQHK